MDNEDKDLSRIRMLLERTSEFIAYFELVESKMREWQENIDQKTKDQVTEHQQQRQSLQTELEALHELLSQTGLKNVGQSMADALSQGEEQLRSLQEKGEKIIEHISMRLKEFNQFSQQNIEKIEQHTTEAIAQFSNTLSEYDIHQFHRVTNESCAHIERLTQDTVNKSNTLLKAFQWRFLSLVLISTLITTFIIGLYVNDELPWETHHQAVNERNVGRMLLQAWPHLSHQEKINILKHETPHHG